MSKESNVVIYYVLFNRLKTLIRKGWIDIGLVCGLEFDRNKYGYNKNFIKILEYAKSNNISNKWLKYTSDCMNCNKIKIKKVSI